MEITHYTSSDGKSTPIVELNNFHLVNALLKTTETIALNPNGFGSAVFEYETLKLTKDALKTEVFRRLAPPKPVDL